MNRKKILLISFSIFLIIFIEIIRLSYTIESVKISKLINIKKIYNRDIQKQISIKKIELSKKMDLDTIKKIAKNELGMEIATSIRYIKIKKQ